MKLKLYPKIAYLVGLWKGRRSRHGVGIVGGNELQSIFLNAVFDLKLSSSNRIQVREGEVFFHHSKLRAFFQEAEKERLSFFTGKNRNAAAFLAGWFDAAGGTEKGVPYFARANREDAFLLEKLGFHTRKVRGNIFVFPGKAFFSFISPFCKNRALLPGNERDQHPQLPPQPPG